MERYEFESIAVMHEMRVLMDRLGEIRKRADNNGWRFPPTIPIRLTPVELLGFATLLEVFKQTKDMSQCVFKTGKPIQCANKFGHAVEVPDELPPTG